MEEGFMEEEFKRFVDLQIAVIRAQIEELGVPLPRAATAQMETSRLLAEKPGFVSHALVFAAAVVPMAENSKQRVSAVEMVIELARRSLGQQLLADDQTAERVFFGLHVIFHESELEGSSLGTEAAEAWEECFDFVAKRNPNLAMKIGDELLATGLERDQGADLVNWKMTQLRRRMEQGFAGRQDKPSDASVR